MGYNDKSPVNFTNQLLGHGPMVQTAYWPTRFGKTEIMTSNLEAYNKLCLYTLSKGDASFIHQHVVDAHAAQTVTENDKPIRLTFALVGIDLHVERGFTGREVQLAHMKLGRAGREWPAFRIPNDRGAMDAAMVLAVPTELRDQAIHEWCRSVWNAFLDQRQQVRDLLDVHGITDAWSIKPRTITNRG